MIKEEIIKRIIETLRFRGSKMIFPMGNGKNAIISLDDLVSIIKWPE